MQFSKFLLTEDASKSYKTSSRIELPIIAVMHIYD